MSAAEHGEDAARPWGHVPDRRLCRALNLCGPLLIAGFIVAVGSAVLAGLWGFAAIGGMAFAWVIQNLGDSLHEELGRRLAARGTGAQQ